MVEFKNKIVQFGFGAVGKSFFEKASKEIKFDKEKYFVKKILKKCFQNIYLKEIF